MSLLSLVDHTKTDKQSRHHYLSVYEILFESYKDTATAILEIGIEKGGSIDLWEQYFSQAIITGIEIQPEKYLFYPPGVKCTPGGCQRRKLLFETDAYSLETVKKLQSSFDIIIEDGSHKLEDMLFVLEHYCKIIKPNGLLIIEDIGCESWKQLLLNAVPKDCFGEFIDCRPVSGIYDSLLFIVKKKTVKE